MYYLILLELLFLMGCGKVDTTSAKGSDGKNGTDGISVSSWFKCALLEPIGSSTVTLIYQITTFTSGNTFITCSVNTTTGQYTSTTWNVIGTTCSVTATIAPDLGGYWVFDILSGIKKAIYHSVGSSNDNHTTILTSGC